MSKVQQRELSAAEQRDRAWLLEANAWAKSMVPAYFQAHKSGLHTAGDVMAWLDGRDDTPPAWARWLGESDYQTRYHMVRNACTALAAAGLVSTGTTYNARGRESAAYTYVEQAAGWAVTVEPADQTDRVGGLVRRWLHEHRDELRGVGSISITLKEEHNENGQGSKHGPVVVRRRRGGSSGV